MVNDAFVARFRAARDSGLPPFEAYRRKKGLYPRDEVILWFVRPIEHMAQEDFQAILLDAAESRALFLDARFRYRNKEDSLQLLVRYHGAYVVPLIEAKAIGNSFCAPYLNDARNEGTISFPLYAREDTPVEHRGRLISRAEFEELLSPYGVRRMPIPERRDN